MANKNKILLVAGLKVLYSLTGLFKLSIGVENVVKNGHKKAVICVVVSVVAEVEFWGVKEVSHR